MEKLKEKIGAFVLFLILLSVIGVIMALPVMLLWNWIMPYLFGVKEIGFMMSLGIIFLCGFLFRSGSSKN